MLIRAIVLCIALLCIPSITLADDSDQEQTRGSSARGKSGVALQERQQRARQLENRRTDARELEARLGQMRMTLNRLQSEEAPAERQENIERAIVQAQRQLGDLRKRVSKPELQLNGASGEDAEGHKGRVHPRRQLRRDRLPHYADRRGQISVLGLGERLQSAEQRSAQRIREFKAHVHAMEARGNAEQEREEQERAERERDERERDERERDERERDERERLERESSEHAWAQRERLERAHALREREEREHHAREEHDRRRDEDLDRMHAMEKMEHLHAASDHLRRAGLGEVAEDVMRQANEIERSLQHADRPPEAHEAAISDLQEQVRDLRRHVQELGEQIRRLIDRVED